MVFSRFVSITLLLIYFVPSSTFAAKQNPYIFSIVPQQTAIKTVKIWKPILKRLEMETGYKFQLHTSKDIPTFEKGLENSLVDFSYMNPYHYTVFHEKSGYNAICKAKDKKIKGIIVVKKDSPITSVEMLKAQKLTFPSAAFAANILPREYLTKINLPFESKYVNSHDTVYRTVAHGFTDAGGGVMRTFKNADPGVKKRLRILWTSEGYTPHAIAAHKRVPDDLVKKVQQELMALDGDMEGKIMLQRMKIKGFVSAENKDWDDVRALNLTELK